VRVISGPKITAAQTEQLELAGGHLVMDDAALPANLGRVLGVVGGVEVWFGPGLTPEMLATAKELRWVQADGVGVDHYLFPELVASSVTVVPIRYRHGTAADQALAMILALARTIPQLVRHQSERLWRPPKPDEVIALDRASLLVIGTGQIGTAVATRAAPFGMVPDGVSRSGRAGPPFRRTYRSDELGDAVRDASFVVNTLPLTPGTAGLVSRAVFEAMRPGSVFVNVGRGATVDQKALIDHLRTGRLRAAGLDVFEEEPVPVNCELWDLPNVILTPHCAGVVPGMPPNQLGIESLVNNLARYRMGEALVAPVDKAAGY
jgi:D-2-hydroxyacid dehydrogenase (NADP+)